MPSIFFLKTLYMKYNNINGNENRNERGWTSTCALFPWTSKFSPPGVVVKQWTFFFNNFKFYNYLP